MSADVQVGTNCSLETKVRTPQDVQGVWRPVEIDVGDLLTSEDVEEQLARFARDPDGVLSSTSTQRLLDRGIVQFEPAHMQSTAEEPRAALDIRPQRLLHRRFEHAGRAAVGAAYILVVNKHLVEVGDASQPAEAEHSSRPGADRGDELREVPTQRLTVMTGGHPRPGTRQHKPGTGDGIVFAEVQVHGDIPSRPRSQNGWSIWAEPFQQVTESGPFHTIEALLAHAPTVNPAAVVKPRIRRRTDASFRRECSTAPADRHNLVVGLRTSYAGSVGAPTLCSAGEIRSGPQLNERAVAVRSPDCRLRRNSSWVADPWARRALLLMAGDRCWSR